MHMAVCVRACMCEYGCMYVCLYVCVWMRVCVFVCWLGPAELCGLAWLALRGCVHMAACICACKCACMSVYSVRVLLCWVAAAALRVASASWMCAYGCMYVCLYVG